MIKAKVLTKDNNYIGYEIQGHANFNEYGNDIVCAAVSAIAQATLIGLHTLDIGLSKGTGEGLLEVKTHAKDKENQDKINLLINTLYMAIRNISNQYPLNVNITIEECDG